MAIYQTVLAVLPYLCLNTDGNKTAQSWKQGPPQRFSLLLRGYNLHAHRLNLRQIDETSKERRHHDGRISQASLSESYSIV